MNVREWKRIAEKEVCRFGDHLAFLKGVEDAGGPKTERYHRSRRWAETVRAVCAYLAVHDAEKERFFRTYYGIGTPKRGRRPGIVAASLALHVSESTLYGWRREVLSLVLIAAAQTGALKPFPSGERTVPDR